MTTSGATVWGQGQYSAGPKPTIFPRSRPFLFLFSSQILLERNERQSKRMTRGTCSVSIKVFPGMLSLMVTTLDKVSGFRRGHLRKRLNAESMCYSFYSISSDTFFISSPIETILILLLASKYVQITILKFRPLLDGKSVTNNRGHSLVKNGRDFVSYIVMCVKYFSNTKLALFTREQLPLLVLILS